MTATTPRFRIPLKAFYLQRLKIDLAIQFAYRASILIWFFGLVLGPLISLVVWRTVANSSTTSTRDAGDYAAYFLAVMVVNQLTFMWHMWEIQWRVQSGHYSSILLRPMHPIHEDLVANLTFKALTLVPLVPIAIVLAIVFDADFNTQLVDVIAFIPAIIFAILLRYVLEWMIGLLAFWITRANSIFQLYSSISFFLTGMIAPLSLFPDSVRTIATVLPFRWMLYFPIQVLLGELDGKGLMTGFAMQIGWLAVAIVAMRAAWNRAAIRYSAVGG